jgi:DNA invertase Pin-like site-specific DNA recombinase
MAVYGYCRVSTDKQAEEGESLGAQERALTGYAAYKGLEEPRLFVEEGISGSVYLQERPEGKKLWEVLQRGDTVLITKLDRAFRDALNAIQTAKYCEDNGIHLHILDMGGDVIENGNAQLMFNILACFSEWVRKGIAENVRFTKADQKARGRYLGGSVPFGFKLDENGALQEDPEQQKALALARDLRAKKVSLRKISAQLATLGHKVSHVTLSGLLDH